MKRVLLIVAIVIGMSVFPGLSHADATGITIGNGATLALNNASMDMGRLAITIENGGTLNLGSGTITNCKKLDILSGGIYIPGTGTISYSVMLPPGMLQLLLLD